MELERLHNNKSGRLFTQGMASVDEGFREGKRDIGYGNRYWVSHRSMMGANENCCRNAKSSI